MNTLDRKLQHLGFVPFTDYQLEKTLAGDIRIASWTSKKPQPTQESLDLIDANELADFDRIQAIKLAARIHILAVFPEWKQANMIARAVDLVDRGDARSASEDTELSALRAAWAWVETVRTESNIAEVAGTPADAVTFTAWPGG